MLLYHRVYQNDPKRIILRHPLHFIYFSHEQPSLLGGFPPWGAAQAKLAIRLLLRGSV